ncbi:hypothetical protein SY2F82_60150 [Streptomyces sp. Y2F8-2]|nr:hypothetical protein SY2F82_60150 [Streptomyces sp. Y2F8-2]
MQAAYAQPYPPTTSPLTLSAYTLTAGQSVTFRTPPGIFARRQAVTVVLESQPIVLARLRAQDDGSVTGTVTIPTRVPTGWHVFRIYSSRPDPSIGVTVYVVGGVTEPTPSPTGTRPGRPGDHHGGSGGGVASDGRNGSHGHRGSDARTASQERTGSGDLAGHRHHAGLAATGSEKALALGGTAAGLIAAGGGTMLAVRRRRSS